MQTQQTTQTHQQGINVPIGCIVPGRNPRTYFDPAEMQELTESVRAQGILQPLLLRPVADGKLQIVAGERRWRAAQAVGLEDVPTLIREMTDEEVDSAALTENIQRAPMSPTDEAEGASRVLGQCAGDREVAARRVGLSRTTFDRRLALMNCSPLVRKALTERKISLGHAELLAAVLKSKQDKVLESLLAAPVLQTVPQLKSMLEQIAQSLDAAIFDKDQCTNCPHNSGTQQALFGEAISGAKCTNSTCYAERTEGALTSLVDSMKDECPTIKIVRPGENFTILKLVAEGKIGVGEDQASRCRGCAKFGAAVSAIPGSVGKVYRNQCFDPVCNTSKVAARIKAEKVAREEITKEKSPKAASSMATSSKDDVARGTDKPKGIPAKVEVSQRLKDYRVKVWRKVFKLEAQQPQFSRVLTLALALCGRLGKVGSSALSKAFDTLTSSQGHTCSNLDDMAIRIAAAEQNTHDLLFQGLAASCFEGLEENDIVRLLTFMQANLGKHWMINGEYLDLLTKSEIQVVADELGISGHLGDKMSKIMSSKKDEIIKALLAIEGFDYKGKVPSHLQYGG